MREIKCRAWHRRASRMLYDSPAQIFKWAEEGQPIEIMQFTGLHDRNGKEVFGGDIVTFEDFHTLITAEVVWNPRGQWDYRPKGWSSGYHAPMVGGNIEVIGSVWEHPELLGSK